MFLHRLRAKTATPSRRVRPADRNGTTVVETAFVLPVFLLFVLGLIEFGHAMMVNNTLRSACRAAARIGSTEGRSTADVENHVRQVLGAALDVNAVEIFVKNAQSLDDGAPVPESGAGFETLPDIELADAEPRQMYLVRAKVNYNAIALVPMPFLEGAVLEGQAFMRHE
ncbi:MAG: TadE family protein [Planctomycetota bacterium]